MEFDSSPEIPWYLKWAKRALIWTALTTLGALSAKYGSKYSSIYLSHYRDPDVQRYVENNLERIVREEEEKLKITHTSVPEIEYILPVTSVSGEIFGLYDRAKDRIYLASGLLILPKKDLGDLAVEIVTFGATDKVEDTLNHELAHSYCFHLSKTLGIKNWPNLRQKNEFEYASLKLVSEGIATYFERTMNGTPDKFKDENWPDDLDFVINGTNTAYFFYDGGYHLVKPIIDKYGQEGIIYLLLNPPRRDELLKLPEYQKRILFILSVQEMMLPTEESEAKP